MSAPSPTSHTPASLDEVRTAIDHIDRHMVRLLGQRAELVSLAAPFKRSEEAVRAPDRLVTMLAERRTWAEEENLDPAFVEAFFRMITSYFIGRELDAWGRENEEAAR